MSVRGLLLAAGAGRRMGTPKALVRDAEGRPWLVRSVATLRDGGCERVTVVLGAAADRAQALLVEEGLDLAGQDLAEQDLDLVVAEKWDEGMGASLRAGLSALDDVAQAAVVLLVDLPDVGPDVVRRLLERPVDSATLARAAYAGTPGHPVLIGRDHWAGVIGSATGDSGARDYLAGHEVTLVECGDLATGRDVDSRPTSGQPNAE